MEDFEKYQEGYAWVKVKRYFDDETLPDNERYDRLMEHHKKETTFLVDKVRELAKIAHELSLSKNR